jgi:ABC-type microcin C transport system permease subunit YejE
MNAFFEVYVSVPTLAILLIIVAVFTKGFVFVVSRCVRYLLGSLTKTVNVIRHRVSDHLFTFGIICTGI